MIHCEFSFNFKKVDFFGQYWDAVQTKAVVVLVHGMGEHSSRYKTSLIPQFLKNDYSVVSFDQFGHGRTKNKKGTCPDYDSVLESVSVVIKKAQELFPDKPIFLYGHSMGGNVVANYILRKESVIAGVICSSPFLRLAFKPSGFKLWLAETMYKFFPSMTIVSDLEVTKISRIKEEVQAYVDDELVHDKISPNFVVPFFESGEWAIENGATLNKPMFLVHGDADEITSFTASEDFSSKSKLIKFKSYKGGYHELHNDICKEELYKDIISWLNDMVG